MMIKSSAIVLISSASTTLPKEPNSSQTRIYISVCTNAAAVRLSFIDLMFEFMLVGFFLFSQTLIGLMMMMNVVVHVLSFLHRTKRSEAFV